MALYPEKRKDRRGAEIDWTTYLDDLTSDGEFARASSKVV